MSSYDIIVDSVSNRVSFTIQIYSQDVSEFEREKASAYNTHRGRPKSTASVAHETGIGI